MFTSHNSNPITASEPLSHRRLEALDILRLLAALAVLLYHFLYRGSIAGGYLDVSYGLTEGPVPLFYFGVPLFFMISGFVIIWSAEGRSGWQFGKSRVIRLYPGHVAAMTLTALVIMVWGTPPFEVSLGQWFANLTMVAPAFGQSFMDGVYWTIVVELIFYFWIALLLLAGILPRYTERVVALWLLIIVVDLLLFQSHAAKLVLLTSYAGCFALGVMAYRIRMHGMTLTRFSLALLAFMLTFTGAERERLVLIDLLGIAPDAGSVAVAQLFTCLAFAVAVHADPEILLVDEALAVGDLIFQHRCMHRMRQLRDAGKTIVLVTHEHDIAEYSKRQVHLKDGLIEQDFLTEAAGATA